MAKNAKPVRIHLNFMRTRLTVVGFNIAVVSFQIAQLESVADRFKVPGVGLAVPIVTDMQLFIAMGLSVFAMLAFIMSCDPIAEAVCTRWSLIAGELLMYLAMAHTVAGFFAPLATVIETVGGEMPNKASEISILESGTIVIGGGAWFLANYVGPAVSLMRSPFQHGTNIALGIAYILVLLVICWLTAQTVRVEAADFGDQPGLIFSMLRELVQPLRW